MARTVRAKALGFYGGTRRRVGDVFTVSDTTKLGKWMEEVKVKEANTPKPPKNEKPPVDELEGLKYNELLARAKALGLAFQQNPTKEDLLTRVKDAEKALPGSLV